MSLNGPRGSKSVSLCLCVKLRVYVSPFVKRLLIPCAAYIQGHDQSSMLSQHMAELTLPKHNPLHRDLLRYAKLMEWLKNTQREKYDGLSRVSDFLWKIIIITSLAIFYCYHHYHHYYNVSITSSPTIISYCVS